MCSYLRGVLATHALMKGLGVGSAEKTALGATLQWVLRDGAGMLGGLAFTTLASTDFDTNVKTWRLFADGINDVALTLDLAAPLFPAEYFTYIVSLR